MAIDFGKIAIEALTGSLITWGIGRIRDRQQAQVQPHQAGQPALQPRQLGAHGQSARVASQPAGSAAQQVTRPAPADLPPPHEFPADERSMFLRRQGDGRAFVDKLTRGTPGVSQGIYGYLDGRSAVPAPELARMLGVPVECWRVVPLESGIVAGALCRARLEQGRAVLGSHSLVLLPTGADTPMYLLFCSPEIAEGCSGEPGQFAIVDVPAPIEAPAPVARVAKRPVSPGAPESETEIERDVPVAAAALAVLPERPAVTVPDGQTIEVSPGVTATREGDKLHVKNATDETVKVAAVAFGHSNGSSRTISDISVRDLTPSPTHTDGDAE